MATHRAYVQQELGGPLEIQTVSTPTPSPGEVLVDVLATPILSYTDGVLSGSLFPLVHPLTLGISAIGRITSTGPDSTRLEAGQLVFCNPMIRARDNYGTNILHGWFGGVSAEARKLMEGPWRNGAWSEKMIVPVENAIPLPEQAFLDRGYSIPQLCWINEFLVPFGGWLTADLKPGSTVIVAPATGHFGGAAVQVALAMGVKRVIAAARNQQALEKVQSLDATGRMRGVQLSGNVGSDTASLRAATGGASADAYLDFSPPHAGGATHPSACIGALKSGGTAVLMGGVTSDISLNYAALMLNNITVKGNFMYPPIAPAQLVALVEAGLLDSSGMEPGTVPFEELLKGIEEAEKKGGPGELMVLEVK